MKSITLNLLFLIISFMACQDKNDPIPYPEDKPIEENTNDKDTLQFTVEDSIAKSQIIGVWSIIYNGLGEDKDTYTESMGIVEFLPNGMMRTYSNYPDEYSEMFTYKISPDYFYKISIYKDSISIGGEWIYRYRFYDDKFRLDLISGITTYHDVYIFKRIQD